MPLDQGIQLGFGSAVVGSSFSKTPPRALPTNRTANRYAVHRWFNFIAGFAPEFAALHSPTEPASLVLDPFAGCGTALVVARALGHDAVGYEPHPIFARIARAKTDGALKLERLDTIKAVLMHGFKHPESVDVLPTSPRLFLSQLFELDTLGALLGARVALEAQNIDQDDMAFLILSRIIEMCSRSKTDGIYKAPSSNKTPVEPEDAVYRVIRDMKVDLGGMTGWDHYGNAECYLELLGKYGSTAQQVRRYNNYVATIFEQL